MTTDPLVLTTSGRSLAVLGGVAKALGIVDLSFTVGPESISMCAVDLSHVTLAQVTLPTKMGPPEPRTVTIAVAKFNEAMKGFGSSDAVDLHLQGARMTLKSGRKRRTVMCDDPRSSGPTPQVPPIEFACRVEVPVKFMREGLKDTDSFQYSSVLLGYDGAGTFKFSMVDMGEDAYENSIEAQGTGSAKCQFTWDRLDGILKLAESDVLVLHLGQDMPLKAEFAVADGLCVILLAPRVQTSDGASE